MNHKSRITVKKKKPALRIRITRSINCELSVLDCEEQCLERPILGHRKPLRTCDVTDIKPLSEIVSDRRKAQGVGNLE